MEKGKKIVFKYEKWENLYTLPQGIYVKERNMCMCGNIEFKDFNN